MAKEVIADIFEKVIVLLKEHNFIQREFLPTQSHVITYRYGTAGSVMKRNVLNEWWNSMVIERECCHVVDNSHMNFSTEFGGSPRANNSGDNSSRMLCPLRSQLLRGCLSHYPNILKQVNRKLPFSIAQTGVCFRLADSAPKDKRFIFDSAEITEMLLLYFCPPSSASQSFDSWQRDRLQWWRQFAGTPSSFQLSEIQQLPNGTSRASVLYQFPWGQDEVESVVNYGEELLKELKDRTGNNSLGKYGRKIVSPVVIACNSILERGVLAFLLDSYREKTRRPNNKNRTPSVRTLLKLHSHLVPYKAAIATCGTKSKELKEIAGHISRELRKNGLQVLDQADAVSTLDSHYARFDQMGVPYTVVVNDNTLDTGLLALRNRDTTLKELVHVTKIKETLLRNIGHL